MHSETTEHPLTEPQRHPPARHRRGHRPPALAGLALVALAVAACGSSASPGNPATPGAAAGDTSGYGAGGGAAAGITFNVQVSFTGADTIQGSFVDAETGAGYSSCSDYATSNTPLGWFSPSPPQNPAVKVQGQYLVFLFTVPQDAFKGPGTYASTLDSVSIGSDVFTGKDSSVTLNADGSGRGSFTNLAGIGQSSGTESGTITWTCSG